jgi:SAM-dependent methyltransferase
MSKWSKSQEKEYWNECTFHSKSIWDCFNPDLDKKPLRNSRTLIAGCGATPVLENSTAALVVNLDISIESLKKLKKQLPDSVIIAADLENLPFKQRSFDYALCLQVLHHTKLECSLNELGQVLTSGGSLISVDINRKNAAGLILRLSYSFLSHTLPKTALPSRDPHECPLSFTELSEILQKTGFRIVSLRPYLFLSPLFVIPLITLFPISEESKMTRAVMRLLLKIDTIINDVFFMRLVGYNIICVSKKT